MRDPRCANGFVPEGRYDRSLARSAWGSATQKSRPVGYGLIRAGVRTGTRSYRTLRDDPLRGRFPRHFVPGYDHAVPLGPNTFSAPSFDSVSAYGVKTLG